MDVEELRVIAKSMGYNIIPIKRQEKLLPCTCGCNKREHWNSLVRGVWSIELRCYKCGKSVLGKSETDAIHNWNEMIRSEQDGCSNIKGKDKN